MIFMKTNILNPYEGEVLSKKKYARLIDFLQEVYPEGFERPTDISVNTQIIPVEDYDIALGENDIVVLLDRTALPAAVFGGSWLLAALANLAISVAASWAINKLFAPETPQDLAAGSNVYSLNNQQNSARLGMPIPVTYGKVRTYPSYIEQPYYRNNWNTEYLYLLLCVGQGRYSIDKLMIDNIDVTHSADVTYRLLNKEHFHNIYAYCGDTNYNVRNNTLSTPNNMDLKNGVTTDYYEITSGVNRLEFDYTYPNGYFNVGDDGAYYDATLRFTIYFYDANKNYLSHYETVVTGQTRTVYRYTKEYNIWSAYKYFRIVNNTGAGVWNDKSASTILFTRVKEKYPTPNSTNYGDITLLYVRMKATNAISAIGQQKVNGYFTRTDVANDMRSVLTDIYTNTEYGGRLSAADLNFPWAAERINGAFDQNLTVFDAMRSVSKSQGYSVFLAGMDVILKKDGVNNVTSGLYNETNILKDSLKVQYVFKEENTSTDGYECSYRDEEWGLQVKTYPSTSLTPSKTDLFGLAGTGADTIAYNMAKYLYKQEEYRRKVVTFNTDIQGLVPQFLDKILISHSALQWGDAGNVYGRNGTAIELSEPIDSSAQTIVFRNIDGSVSAAHALTYVDEYNVTVPAVDAWVDVNTAYTVQGLNTAKEFLVIGIKPSGEESVTIECVNYSEEVYT